ncbi:hypothetical protein FOZ60_015629 [Perkinsus olseni]|uniref:Transcription factor TFIIIB component B'' Myb domain-containing protein n=1 Tax=Perkinsus olseni TaxID=32597 RepID=A0A7J6PKQ8_PEROL|nr:hypothetical protein FOZ60_015629 [Perkinsus olseni]
MMALDVGEELSGGSTHPTAGDGAVSAPDRGHGAAVDSSACVVIPSGSAGDGAIDPTMDVFSNAPVPSVGGDSEASPLSTSTDVVPSNDMTELVLPSPTQSPSSPGDSGSEVGSKRRGRGRRKKSDKALTSTQISRRIGKRLRTELGMEPCSTKKNGRAANGAAVPSSHAGQSSHNGMMVDLINKVVAQETAEEKNRKKSKSEGESPKTPATQAEDLTPLDGAFGDLFGLGIDKPTSASSPSSIGGAVGGPQPQLKFDESGNIVLQQASSGLTGDVFGDLSMMTTTDESGRCEYKDAYKRSNRSVWSDKETDKFYEALSMYGPDLMMISTVFGSYKNICSAEYQDEE